MTPPPANLILAECYAHGIAFRWQPTGLDVLGPGPLEPSLMSFIREHYDLIRSVIQFENPARLTPTTCPHTEQKETHQ